MAHTEVAKKVGGKREKESDREREGERESNLGQKWVEFPNGRGMIFSYKNKMLQQMRTLLKPKYILR